MNEKELLQDALLIIKDKGWTQGSFQDEKGRVCLVGSLRLAAFGHTHGGAGFSTPKYTVYNKVMNRIRDAVGSIYFWNDRPGQSKENVLNLLRKLISNS